MSNQTNVEYQSLKEALDALVVLGINSLTKYKEKYSKDPRLPKSLKRSFPDEYKKEDFYSYTEAAAVVRRHAVHSRTDYQKFRALDPRLPEMPGKYYPQFTSWSNFVGLKGLTNRGDGLQIYQDVSEAISAVARLGIKTWPQYKERYSLDPRLPKSPHGYYKVDYPGWKVFSGGESIYPTYEEASLAAQKLGARSYVEYKKLRHLDKRLPSNPAGFYGEDFLGVSEYLGISKSIKQRKIGFGDIYNFEEFCIKVNELGIRTFEEYKLVSPNDPKMPGRPGEFYKENWTGWRDIFINYYPTLDAAIDALQKLECHTSVEYRDRCKADPMLPKFPERFYPDFPGFVDFLMPPAIKTYEDLQRAIRILRIGNYSGYLNARKDYPQLILHPERKFSTNWSGWNELFGVSKIYSYDELRDLVQAKDFVNSKEYKKWARNDPRTPVHPQAIYPEWTNWYEFLGKDVPYKLEFVCKYGSGWLPYLREFLEVTKAASIKESNLCKFIRNFIVPSKLGSNPLEFLTSPNQHAAEFPAFLDTLLNKNQGRSVYIAVNQFLDFVLAKYFTVEDEDTGEVVSIQDAKNQLAKVDYSGDGAPNSESTKPALAYHFVESAKNWMVPPSAKNFSDLTNIQMFKVDWVEVGEGALDKNDPDCVWKIEGDKFYLWVPVCWMLAYALVSVPARGRQLAYNDSGEGDAYIADIVEGGLVLVPNAGKLAGATKNQAFVRFYNGEYWGMHYTSNKTSKNNKPYDVPWIPVELAYWMVKLRKWQEKYNPIKSPTPWTDLLRTDLNKAQLAKKGANCFLFRDYGDVEAPFYSGRLSERLATALYFTQPKSLKLARLKEGRNEGYLSAYESDYTPHSMRVSLITAYVIEFGMPIEIVMKLVGHASIVMSLYYVKLTASAIKVRLDEVYKRSLDDNLRSVQELLEQQRVDSLFDQFIGSSEQALQTLSNARPGSLLFRDYGLCPNGASRCDVGGPAIGATQEWKSTPAGYLGIENCFQCRFLVTGPVFLGGLCSMWNEISLECRYLAERYSNVLEKIDDLRDELDKQDELEFVCSKGGASFDSSARDRIEREINRLSSESESQAKKIDMYYCDLQAITKFIRQSIAVINELSLSTEDEDKKVHLIVTDKSEIQMGFEDVSLFRQLNEVCENAVIYVSANSSFAAPRRSQLIDNMSVANGLSPVMCRLSDKQQLVLGNQIAKFLLARLRSWDRVDDVVSGRVLLEELGDGEKLTKYEFSEFLQSASVKILKVDK